MEEGETMFELKVQVKDTNEAKARALLGGMQGLVNDLGVDRCLDILNKIKAHPREFRKALSLIDNPTVLALINAF